MDTSATDEQARIRLDAERAELERHPEPQRVGAVVAGAGARGAYEAGVLSVLLPKLDAAGARPEVFVGASAGAINATVLAAHAHRPAEAAAEALLQVWRSTRLGDVFRSLLRSALPTVLQYGAEFVGVPWPRLTGLLDTSPQRALADHAIDWDQLTRNVTSGVVQALAVVATSVATGRTTVFVQRAKGVALPPTDPYRALDYVDAAIGPEHVLASSAIPVAFPAVKVDGPRSAAGWYTDGGVRLNTPIRPALALDVDHVVVVATHPASYPAVAPGPSSRPEVDDMAVQVAEAVVVDRMVEDLRRLGTINELVAGGGQRPYPGRSYKKVPYLFAGPTGRHDLGELARVTYAKSHRGLKGTLHALWQPNIPLLRRLITDTGGARQGDLLSFLYFEPEFVEAAVQRGRQDAEAMLGRGGLPWRLYRC